MIEEAFDAARRAELPVMSLFIIGHPNETPSSIRETMDLATKLNPHTPAFGVMVPYPGTEIARLAARGEGGYRLVTSDWDEFNKQIGGALEFAGLTRAQIEWAQFSGYLRVFLNNWRLLDLVTFCWSYRVSGLKLARRILENLFSRADPRRAHPNSPVGRLPRFDFGLLRALGRKTDRRSQLRQNTWVRELHASGIQAFANSDEVISLRETLGSFTGNEIANLASS
jgi:radical SAM superfamily enzyme YgiQ (UPF0313 family)